MLLIINKAWSLFFFESKKGGITQIKMVWVRLEMIEQKFRVFQDK